MELLERPEDQIENAGQTLPAEQAPEEATPALSETNEEIVAETEDSTMLDKDTIVTRLEEIAAAPDDKNDADEALRLKRIFYTIEHQQQQKAYSDFIAAGGDPEEYVADKDPREERIKELLTIIKEKKARERERLNAMLLRNSERKQAIIDELTEMSADTDNVNRHWQRAKELQDEFKAIGEVPQEVATLLWKNFTTAVERFYDQWKVNRELRDYDFKKNLADKRNLIDETKQLADNPDVIAAYKRLQDIHQIWRETGPVAKEFRDEIWNEFREASAVVSKRYQAYFEERKARERENEEAKTAICERVEAIDSTAAKSFAEWNELTKAIMQAQADWKQLGQASRKMNNALFARFRETCDKFFAAKAEFFKDLKDSQATNLEKKTALCERAEALKESTDWRATTDELLRLKEEWRAIGPVPKKASDAIWRRFMDACDHFFDRKKKITAAKRKEESANLRAKRDIIDKLTAMNAPDCATDRAEAIPRIHELRALWQSTGHVPIKEKEKITETYRTVVGELFDKYDIRENRARMSRFESAVENTADGNKLLRDRERLLRILEQRRSDLKTYENNMGFFNSRSKSGEQMLREMERKMQHIKDEIAELEKKIAIIDKKV